MSSTGCLTVGKVASMHGSLRPPSDKSLTHRAYLFASIADGPSVIRTPLEGEDCQATLACLRDLGVGVESNPDGAVMIAPADWAQPQRELDCGNSGTTMRLLAGLVASRSLDVTLIGDASLSRRPMRRIAEPLRLMGALVEGDTPPLRIRGGDLSGIRYATPVASAQIKSCVLLAGLGASGETWVSEPSPSRDHTERMLEALGVELLRDGDAVGVRGGSTPAGFEFSVPADISSAAFFIVAAAMLPGASLLLEEVSVNPTRTGILDVLAEVGIRVVPSRMRSELGEPVADLEVGPQNSMGAFEICGRLVPRLIDEIPVLAVLATQCDGISEIRDAAELRVKESDRIETVANGLRAMGAKVETLPDGLRIWGPCRLRGAEIDASGDHRIGMAFAIAGLIADGQTRILGAEAIHTSYPRFEEDLWRLAVV